MKAINIREAELKSPSQGTQDYISQMLEELSKMAQASGLIDLASLLRATVVVSKVGLSLEHEA